MTENKASAPAHIVLIHGLWTHGLIMLPMAHMLQKYGYDTHHFSYHTISETLEQSAARLQEFVQQLAAEQLHFVGHSLGGLLIRKFLQRYPDQAPGRIVTLGTPHSGSYVASHLGRSGLMRKLFGCSLPPLTGDITPWQGERELGAIAGSRSIGLGFIIRDLPKPNDGTVSIDETRLETMRDHITLPYTHTSMLMAEEVAKQVHDFLQTGQFSH